ncbi:hypothetical protein ACFOEE_14550 [Pseudoalteromonas fenneropenaei]|uniref:Energy transducer TonB n=1 Tax=Pseudoalteromonas fenneropenaei TaxID=1737459 RepID=A0ABV7CMF4_9GAMM
MNAVKVSLLLILIISFTTGCYVLWPTTTSARDPSGTAAHELAAIAEPKAKIAPALVQVEALQPDAIALVQTTPQATPEPDSSPIIYLPPIAKSSEQHLSNAYQGDLDDHEAYQRHQQKQQDKLKHEFVAASKIKIAKLESLLAQGIAAGLEESQLAEAREKIAALAALSHKLQTELESN